MKRPDKAGTGWPTLIILFAVILAIAQGTATAAPRTLDPDWPCQQVKVSELSVGSFWSGPPIDPDTAQWQQDEAVASLAGTVSQRRLPIDQAAQRVTAFVKSQGKDKAALLFAAIFDVLNQEREKVIAGLDRFGKRQKDLAINLRQEISDLQAEQAKTPADEAKIAELTNRVTWDRQFFETRRQSLSLACDVPTVIEQRLYGLAQAIQQRSD